MYISRHDSNIGSLDSTQDWIDYIMTQTWIDELAKHTLDQSSNDAKLVDNRIEHLSNLVQGMMVDHEIDYHKTLAEFDADVYIDNGKSSNYQDAYNKLMTFGRLEYGFYEFFKPIGNTTEKFVKVRVSTNGNIDIYGVIGLSDCEHVEWKYGTPEYLRALNTGNERYDFKLSIPFNDENSTLWWKPDGPEPYTDQEQQEYVEANADEDDETQEVVIRQELLGDMELPTSPIQKMTTQVQTDDYLQMQENTIE